MRWRALKQVDALIARYGLHQEGAPVDLSPLHEAFIRRIAPIKDAEIPAFAIPPACGEVSLWSPAFVIINEMFPEDWQRLYYAHEVCHVEMGHGGALRSLDTGKWWQRNDELEAWRGTARLLIPPDEIEDGTTYSAVARACRVPIWLAQLYPVEALLQTA